jgi:hypothetical protein
MFFALAHMSTGPAAMKFQGRKNGKTKKPKVLKSVGSG